MQSGVADGGYFVVSYKKKMSPPSFFGSFRNRTGCCDRFLVPVTRGIGTGMY